LIWLPKISKVLETSGFFGEIGAAHETYMQEKAVEPGIVIAGEAAESSEVQ